MNENALIFAPVVFTFAICFSTAALLISNTYMILANKSTIESSTLHYNNPFNKGTLNNWKEIFGESYSTWLIPTQPNVNVYKYS